MTMFSKLAQSSLAAAFLLSPLVHGFWILSPTSLVQERLDPIVSPGEVSNHVHNIAGASNFGPDATYDSLQSSNCTSSPVQADMSNYWAPQLYYQNSSGLTLIPISFLQFYYLQRGGTSDPDATNITAFPEGLRMIAGNLSRTSYNESNVADLAINYKCLDYDGTTTSSNGFPTTQCPDGLRAQIVFPSCWDGVNLDSDDHQSHMSYPTGGAPDNGDCPDTHPTKLVTLFNEWVFDVASFDFESGANNWVFSFGDETGYGFHADFLNGWDVDVLQDAIDQCTGDLFDDIESCPPFVDSIDRTKAESCTISRVVEEEVDGPLDNLPGCQTIPFSGIQECTSEPSISGYTATAAATSTASSASASGTGSSSAAAATTTSAAASSSTITTATTTTASASDSDAAGGDVLAIAATTDSSSSSAVTTSATGACKKKRSVNKKKRAPVVHVPAAHKRYSHDFSF